VTDEEILAAYRWLAGKEGIFCEPASAASVAGLLKVKDRVPDRARVVCVLTGNGLKDPDTAIKSATNVVKQGIEANLESVATAMGF
jgi:threonine synthase